MTRPFAPSAGLYVVGTYEQGGIDLGGRFCPNGETSDFFVASYWSDDLAPRWSECFHGTGNEWGHSIVLDQDGNLYVTGAFEGTFSIGGEVLQAEGYVDIFVASLSPEGDVHWARSFGGPNVDQGVSAVVDTDGEILVIGDFEDIVDFDGTELTSRGGHDAFVAVLGPDGAVRHAESFGGPGRDFAAGIAIDDCGNVWVAGGYTGTLEAEGRTLTAAGGFDIFVLKSCMRERY